MKLEDLSDGQTVALIKSYNYLDVGLTGTVLGFSKKRQMALVLLDNKWRTEEYIPLPCLIGILQ